MATKKIQKELSDSIPAPKKVRKKSAPKKSAVPETMVQDVPATKIVKKKVARKKVAAKTTTKKRTTAKKTAAKKPARRTSRSTASERARKATIDSIVQSIAIEEAPFEKPTTSRIRGGDVIAPRQTRVQRDHAATVHRAVVFAELYLLSTVITIFIVGAVTLLSLLFTLTV